MPKLIEDFTDTNDKHQISGYCSWCLKKTTHDLINTRRLRRDVYRCSECRRLSVFCSIPGCSHFARAGNWGDDVWCAAHGGKIPGFESASRKLSTLEQYPQLFEREVFNFGKYSKIISASVLGATLLTPLAIGAGPTVGRNLARSLSIFRGLKPGYRFLKSASFRFPNLLTFKTATSLKAFGTLGAAAGAFYGGKFASDFQREVHGFAIRRIKNGDFPAVIIINGFLSQDRENLDCQWKQVLKDKYPDSSWYIVDWESRKLRSLSNLFTNLGRNHLLKNMFRNGIQTTRKFVTTTGMLCAASTIIGSSVRAWQEAKSKASATGKLLAYIFDRLPESHTFILIGHSLGAHVIFQMLNDLKTHSSTQILESHLLGGAIGKDPSENWESITSKVISCIYNYYSTNDHILGSIFSTANLFLSSKAIGIAPINSNHPKLMNIDVSHHVRKHSEFRTKASLFLK
ncbi:DUF726 domain-containing protein [bacterium]|nr:DUF726 domain-containing protein [candidate division CSSED10-310 bacterium]